MSLVCPPVIWTNHETHWSKGTTLGTLKDKVDLTEQLL